MPKYFTFGLLFLLGLGAILFWREERPMSLNDLLKKLLRAEASADTALVLTQLEQYYLKLETLDSLSLLVESQVQQQVDNPAPTAANFFAVDPAQHNVYELEDKLQESFALLSQANVRMDKTLAAKLRDQARGLAATVDAELHSKYWSQMVEQVAGYTSAQARMYLQLKGAEQKSKQYYESDGGYKTAEQYIGLGFRLLQHVNDQRIRLGLVQRLAWILYSRYSLYELALALVQKARQEAFAVSHYRYLAFLYLEAELMFKLGQNQAALAQFEAVLAKADEYRLLPSVQWYKKSAWLRKGDVLLELGELSGSLAACREVNRYSLTDKEQITLQILKSKILKGDGFFDQAVQELEGAKQLAEATHDTSNLIMCLNNLGVISDQLSEYTRALSYYAQARAWFTNTMPDVNTRMLVYQNNAFSALSNNDTLLFQNLTRTTKEFSELLNNDWIEAQSLYALGSMYKKAKKYHKAMRDFKSADSIYSANGFSKYALSARIQRVACLVEQSDLNTAQTEIDEILASARAQGEVENEIDAVNKLAEIYYRQGEVKKAAEISNRLCSQIENLSARFKNAGRLMAFRQKVYTALKSAVFYEIACNRVDSAFFKLGEFKAYALKDRSANLPPDLNPSASASRLVPANRIKFKLPEKSLIVDYMMWEDSLYTFVLSSQGLKLHKGGANLRTLKSIIAAYQDSITQTEGIFDNYDDTRVNLHYRKTQQMAQALYGILFEGLESEPEFLDAELLYIIPEEFLYGLPFATLVSDNSEHEEFLIKHKAIVTLPSSRFLPVANLAEAASFVREKKVLMSINREFPGAEQLADTIKSLFPQAEEFCVGQNNFTNEDILRKLREKYAAFIFVGHGAANPTSPEHSSIELTVKTPAYPGTKVFRLTLTELEKIGWVEKELVMLVGCKTGYGPLYRGTGILGMQQVFLRLGAQNVLGNLWDVDSRQTIAMVRDFTTAWQATGNVAKALQTCQELAIQNLDGDVYYQKPHPYFWGSTVLLTVNHSGL